jgi:hypothetical protein
MAARSAAMGSVTPIEGLPFLLLWFDNKFNGFTPSLCGGVIYCLRHAKPHALGRRSAYPYMIAYIIHICNFCIFQDAAYLLKY